MDTVAWIMNEYTAYCVEQDLLICTKHFCSYNN